MQKYSVNQYEIASLLAFVKSGEIAIPEIQRPFVWDSSKVRNLMDSLYQGYPIGYIIAWKNPNVRLKDGSFSEGKKVLIDGQQRVTALSAAILGNYVIDKNYSRIRIKIAFNPVEERFEVQNPAILKDKLWLPDIAEVFNGKIDIFDLVDKYLDLNPESDKQRIRQSFSSLMDLPKKAVGLIELSSDLDIETVTEIFIRINSAGVVLSQADFAMSKITANEEQKGNILRKAIDYFCHLAVAPEFYQHIVDNDKEFAQTEFFRKMEWLKNENDDLYDPSYVDLLRVAFTSQFERGRLSDLVSLLSGRNFENRTFENEIVETSFATLKKGILEFINETNFKRFLMIIRSAGFISPKLLRSQNAVNFAYIVFLILRSQKNLSDSQIEKYVKRWLVYSILTGRYSGSPESVFDYDIKQMSQRSIIDYMAEKEEGELSDAFWNAALPQSMDTSVASSPYFHVYLAAQVKLNDKGFLSKDITVCDLINFKGDIHHLFPKDYLKKNGFTRSRYNQIANYVYMQSEINIKVGNKSPKEYFDIISTKMEQGDFALTGITSVAELQENLKMNCIPENIGNHTLENYNDFLIERRRLMALKIKEYYFSL